MKASIGAVNFNEKSRGGVSRGNFTDKKLIF